MARARIVLFRPLPTILKFLLCAGLTLLLIISFHSIRAGISWSVLAAPGTALPPPRGILNELNKYKPDQLLIAQPHSEVLFANPGQSASMFIEQGHQELQQGRAQAALQSWSDAYQIYRKSGNSEGMTGSLINQSLALQALGLYPRACQSLAQALKLTEEICTSPAQNATATLEKEKQLILALQKQPLQRTQVLGLQNLGNVLRLIGKPDTSLIVLKKAIEFAKSLNLESNINNQILLYLANTERTLYHEAKNKYLSTDEEISKQKALSVAQSKFQKALELYHQNSTKILAQLKQLSLLLELQSSPEDLNFQIKGLNTQERLKTLVKQLLAAQFSAQFRQLPTIESIYDQLNFATSLQQINSDQKLRQLFNNDNENLLNVALSTAFGAWQVAQKIDNPRAQSYALGTLASIYKDLGQIPKAENYFQKALGLAKSVQAPDVAYQWQQQLGRLYKQTGKFSTATQIYAETIISLDQVQNSILSVNPEFQFSFKQKIEPIYQEYLDLLTLREKPDLKLIIKTKEQMQLAELKNFLQCSQLPIIPTREIQPTPLATTIYLLNLGKRVDVIVKSTNGELHQHIVDLELFTDAFNSLLINLQSDRFVDLDTQTFVNLSQSLYQLLIAPIKNFLPSSGTLVFVPDTYFQNFPFALLHDGKNYLLQSYGIAIALNSQFQQQLALKAEDIKVLAAGISKPNPNFKDPLIPKNLTPLPEVETELISIKQHAYNALELLNASFTGDNLRKQIDHFPIVHLSSHGQFSSDPEQTFILAWNKLIKVRELDSLLRRDQKVVELLVLSACQTAKGDRRSPLGIAGVALQAGARSTLASLWLVDSASTAQLMGEFYKGLKNGLNTADALRQAQLTLLNHPKYSHPYYWSPFILLIR